LADLGTPAQLSLYVNDNIGFTVVFGPNDRKGNMVARLRGTGKGKPILIIAHLDVVEAKRSDWTTDPFQFVEKDGFFYGRGTQDMKDSDAIAVTNAHSLFEARIQAQPRHYSGLNGG
jgi:acetylornithine deacetylase/succinyl-diaminopimelate desuccinylase-like protein